jgi:hypothetical protein
MRVQVAVPEARVSRPILDAMLEGTTRVNEALLAHGDVPTFEQAVEHVRWKPEPPGQEHFDHAALVMGRGWGDCDDLAPWHAASLRVTGEDPGARAIVKKSGAKRWHAIVQRSDGSIEDPSRAAGMGQPQGVAGAVVPVMFSSSVVGGSYVARPQLALRPLRDRTGQVEAWQARADLPWHYQPGNSPGDIAMVSLHRSPVSSQAIVGACRGGMRLGAESRMVGHDHLDRVACIADACDGADYDELAEVYGDEHAQAAMQIVGSFFSSITKPFKKLARVVTSPLGQTALSFIPGVGPVAASALRMASPALQKMLARGGASPRRVPRGFAAVEPGAGRFRGLNIRVQPFS